MSTPETTDDFISPRKTLIGMVWLDGEKEPNPVYRDIPDPIADKVMPVIYKRKEQHERNK